MRMNIKTTACVVVFLLGVESVNAAKNINAFFCKSSTAHAIEKASTVYERERRSSADIVAVLLREKPELDRAQAHAALRETVERLLKND